MKTNDRYIDLMSLVWIGFAILAYNVGGVSWWIIFLVALSHVKLKIYF